MFQKFLGVAFLLLLGTYIVTSPAQSQDDPVSATTSWRHLALTSEDQSDPKLAPQINQLGSDGWELVDVENFQSQGETVKTVYYFKKPQ